MWERSIPTITPAWTWSLLCPSSTCTTTVGPILAWQFHQPPAKFIHSYGGADGYALNSLVCSGAVVTGGRVDQSILAPGVRVNARAEVRDSVLFDGVDVGEGAIIRRAILYRMDPRQLLEAHIESGAGVSVAALLRRQRTGTDQGRQGVRGDRC